MLTSETSCRSSEISCQASEISSANLNRQRQIVIYGGSFNPPHLGHRRCVEILLQQMNPDLVLIVPDYLPPHKDLPEGSPSPTARLELCRLNFEGLRGVMVDDCEIRRAGKSYTVDTITEYHRRYPQDSLSLLIGSDMLLSFHRWKRVDEILRQSSLAVVSREEDDQHILEEAARSLRDQYGATVTIYTGKPLVISSTQIRSVIGTDQARKYLSESVYQEILRNGYYSCNPTQRKS